MEYNCDILKAVMPSISLFFYVGDIYWFCMIKVNVLFFVFFVTSLSQKHWFNHNVDLMMS